MAWACHAERKSVWYTHIVSGKKLVALSEAKGKHLVAHREPGGHHVILSGAKDDMVEVLFSRTLSEVFNLGL